MRFVPGELASFNTQPPEGGWDYTAGGRLGVTVSTHSRLKAAGQGCFYGIPACFVSTHSRLKAAGLDRGTAL